jgi:hypothetical protein
MLCCATAVCYAGSCWQFVIWIRQILLVAAVLAPQFIARRRFERLGSVDHDPALTAMAVAANLTVGTSIPEDRFADDAMAMKTVWLSTGVAGAILLLFGVTTALTDPYEHAHQKWLELFFVFCAEVLLVLGCVNKYLWHEGDLDASASTALEVCMFFVLTVSVIVGLAVLLWSFASSWEDRRQNRTGGGRARATRGKQRFSIRTLQRDFGDSFGSSDGSFRSTHGFSMRSDEDDLGRMSMPRGAWAGRFRGPSMFFPSLGRISSRSTAVSSSGPSPAPQRRAPSEEISATTPRSSSPNRFSASSPRALRRVAAQNEGSTEMRKQTRFSCGSRFSAVANRLSGGPLRFTGISVRSTITEGQPPSKLEKSPSTKTLVIERL